MPFLCVGFLLAFSPFVDRVHVRSVVTRVGRCFLYFCRGAIVPEYTCSLTGFFPDSPRGSSHPGRLPVNGPRKSGDCCLGWVHVVSESTRLMCWLCQRGILLWDQAGWPRSTDAQMNPFESHSRKVRAEYAGAPGPET